MKISLCSVSCSKYSILLLDHQTVSVASNNFGSLQHLDRCADDYRKDNIVNCFEVSAHATDGVLDQIRGNASRRV